MRMPMPTIRSGHTERVSAVMPAAAQHVDCRVFEEVDGVGEQGNRSNGDGDAEFHAEIGEVERRYPRDGFSQSFGYPGGRLLGGHGRSAFSIVMRHSLYT